MNKSNKMQFAKNVEDKNKTVAFCLELKMKAALFQVELYCKLWIWGASSGAVIPRLHVVSLAEWGAEGFFFFSQKTKSWSVAHTASTLWTYYSAPGC